MTPTPPDKDEQDKRDIIASVANDYYDSLKDQLFSMSFEESGEYVLKLATEDVNRLIARERLSELKLLRESYSLDMDYEPIDKRILELQQSIKEERDEQQKPV